MWRPDQRRQRRMVGSADFGRLPIATSVIRRAVMITVVAMTG
jgi:hypothetical protein